MLPEQDAAIRAFSSRGADTAEAGRAGHLKAEICSNKRVQDDLWGSLARR